MQQSTGRELSENGEISNSSQEIGILKNQVSALTHRCAKLEEQVETLQKMLDSLIGAETGVSFSDSCSGEEKKVQEDEKKCALSQIAYESLLEDEAVRLLSCVARGQINEAASIIALYPETALYLVGVMDGSGREFSNITALQYAVWALDWPMARMIMSHLSQDQATEQIVALKRDGAGEHGVCYDHKPLINAYSSYANNFLSWRDSQCRAHWVAIGKMQATLPDHLLGAFMAVWPKYQSPNFKRDYARDDKQISRDVDWCRSHRCKRDGRLGETWAISNIFSSDRVKVSSVLKIEKVLEGCDLFSDPCIEVNHPEIESKRVEGFF